MNLLVISYINQLSMKRKIYAILGSMGIILLVGLMINGQVLLRFIGDVNGFMDDISISYRFQEILKEEADAFDKQIRDGNQDNEKQIRNISRITDRSVSQLPFDYNIIGEKRYEITWSIKNSYEIYQDQRNRVLEMSGDESGYIDELYRTYQMQDYLQSYASRLTKEVIRGNNTVYEERTLETRRFPYMICLTAVLILVVFFYLTKIFTKDIISVLDKLVKASKEIENSNYLVEDVVWKGRDEFAQLTQAFNKMKHSTRNYVLTLEEKRLVEEKLHEQKLEKANLEQKFSQAKLQLITSQLNPHFLFNTLNMIYRMTQIEEAKNSSEMLFALSNLLRYSLRTTEPLVPLSNEIKNLEDYMYIQEKRFGQRVKYHIDCKVSNMEMEIPVFLLQPLVENAIIHGISMKEEGGNIHIEIQEDGQCLYIQVKDDGQGIPKEKLHFIQKAIKQRENAVGIGIGLGNIYGRISAYYEYGDVAVESQEGVGTKIKMVLDRRKL